MAGNKIDSDVALEMFKQGATLTAIAARFGCSVGAVSIWKKKKGLTRSYNRSPEQSDVLMTMDDTETDSYSNSDQEKDEEGEPETEEESEDAEQAISNGDDIINETPPQSTETAEEIEVDVIMAVKITDKYTEEVFSEKVFANLIAIFGEQMIKDYCFVRAFEIGASITDSDEHIASLGKMIALRDWFTHKYIELKKAADEKEATE